MGTNGYVMETEIESRYGRVGLMIYPKERRYGEYALVMELKRANNENDLEEIAKETIEQIKEREYSGRYEKLGYKVTSIGIFFMERKLT